MPFVSQSSALAAGPSDSRPSLYVVPFQSAEQVVTPESLTEVESYYRTLVSMNSSVRLIDPEGAPKASVPVVAPKPKVTAVTDRAVLSADAKFETAKSMAAQGKWAAAAKSVTRIVRTYEKKLSLLPNISRLEAAYTLLVQARYGQGFEDDGEDLLWRLLAINPDADLSSFSTPKIEAAVQRVRRRLAIPTGTLKVTCATPDCTVSIDGKPIPGVEASSLPRGMHYLQVRAPGYKPWGQVFEAPSRGQTLVVKARQRKMSRAELAASNDNPVPATTPVSRPADSGTLQKLVEAGEFGPAFQLAADTFCRRTGAQFLVMGYMNRIGGQYVLAGFLYSASLRQVAEVGSALVPLDVKGVQSKMMSWEGRISRSIRRFPAERVVVVKPSIYQKPRTVAVAPTPVPAVPPTPAPVPVVPPTPAPVAPAPSPVPVAPTPVMAPTPQQYPPVVAPVPSQYPPQQPQTKANPVYRPQPTYRAPAPTPSQYPMTPPAVTPAPVPVQPVPTMQPTPLSPTPVPPSVVRRPVPEPAPAPAPNLMSDTEMSDDTPVYKTWWLWTIVGAVVVGGAVTAGVLLAPGDDPPKSFNATATFE